ncbi:hypothetical protein EBH_0085430 [Eimeria brunetti]|uniref:Uncharacterized protein n=1 Tax=Eimeria brunetti TaxID=51314 RepID=U6M069_9EIME|nr:hypothetical protein EBH_0085430 [Eimeria brunetti]
MSTIVSIFGLWIARGDVYCGRLAKPSVTLRWVAALHRKYASRNMHIFFADTLVWDRLIDAGVGRYIRGDFSGLIRQCLHRHVGQRIDYRVICFQGAFALVANAVLRGVSCSAENGTDEGRVVEDGAPNRSCVSTHGDEQKCASPVAQRAETWQQKKEEIVVQARFMFDEIPWAGLGLE